MSERCKWTRDNALDVGWLFTASVQITVTKTVAKGKEKELLNMQKIY